MIAAGLITDLIILAIALLWAKGAKLDLGLRPPAWRKAWPWILLYVAWYAAEWVVFSLYPADEDPEFVAMLNELTLPGTLLLTCLAGPLFEELLFRGAMFSALLRRWGPGAALIVPSILWGVLHIGYEAWFVVSVAGSGVVLAMIRWRSGSLYVPLALHAAGNLVVTIAAYASLPGAG